MTTHFLYKIFNDGASDIPDPGQFSLSLALRVTFSGGKDGKKEEVDTTRRLLCQHPSKRDAMIFQ